MKILIDDIIQNSDAPDELKSPSLADTYTNGSTIEINVPVGSDIDCIGIGNTDASFVTINGELVTLDITEKTGLYLIDTVIDYDIILGDVSTDMYLGDVSTDIILGDVQSPVTIEISGTYVGRIALGKYRDLYPSPAREPGFYTTQKPRVTASGNVVEGAGGVSGRELNLDFRYKFTLDIFNDIESAFSTQIAKGFPFFLYFDKETQWISWLRIYGRDTNRMLFQSSVNRFLYSKRMKLIEAF